MGVFFLKYRDTLPVLEVVLKNPDDTVFNLTGTTSWKLHVWLSTDVTKATPLIRDMTKFGADANGTLRYQWVAADWGAYASAGAVGGLVVGPTLPLIPGQVEHRMEYEVLAATVRITFPNGGYDTLRILTDIGQG